MNSEKPLRANSADYVQRPSDVGGRASSGGPWIWLTAAAITTSVLVAASLLLVLVINGIGHFWPSDLLRISYLDASGTAHSVNGLITVRERQPQTAAQLTTFPGRTPGRMPSEDIHSAGQRWLVKTGNRDVTGRDYIWVNSADVTAITAPASLMLIKRTQWGDAIGIPELLLHGGIATSLTETEDEQTALVTSLRERLEHNRKLAQRISVLEKEVFSSSVVTSQQDLLLSLYEERQKDELQLRLANGQTLRIRIETIVDFWQPNQMNIVQKAQRYLLNGIDFLFSEPREANTDGGIFPALFGTVLMVVLMSVFVTPLGVITALYLHEYAADNKTTKFLRISVNNLAGVPSIVFGVFGLGFFVYLIGGSIDQLFFSNNLPTPTFGTPGLLWAALTLALLTVPVVIVATEEGLARIPKSTREASIALGATQWETIVRIVLPMASPAILTGVILAVARAAGEVAPLMLVGVVKLAAELPLDGEFPFLHLDRKFMHLGFHIYDVGFQSPNVDAGRPLVFATALLLICLIIALNLIAMIARHQFRERYRPYES